MRHPGTSRDTREYRGSGQVKQRFQNGPDLVQYSRLCRSSRVDSICLHHARLQCDILEQKRQERFTVFRSQFTEQGLKLLGVTATIVGRDAHFRDDHPGAGLLAGPDHRGQVAARSFQGDATQAIIAAQFDHDDDGLLLFQQSRQSGKTALGGVTSDAGVENAVSVTMFIKTVLQQARPGLADLHVVGSAKAVTEDQDDRGFISR